MAELKYKTRGMCSPQGKPRIYFCCHPLDFEKYFTSISDDILKKQNCAIWYLEDLNAARDENFLTDLTQMQLFIMPVSKNLLTTRNEALHTEFKFAAEHHIPVLPLIQESGLVELFNQECGQLQFLDPNDQDLTAISYEEKLEKYLSSVLIGDELAEMIRSAFHAYIFLSYRKKDRKYAQELMRLIHKNDFCRDFAIWYDEFLVPGENFNHSIENALHKSDLFVLAVTPNLINEVNYIMTTEYPLALKAEKQILPFELLPTDQVQLHEKYKNLPFCTDAHNEEQLSEALSLALDQLEHRAEASSPEHDFYIGLAYLSGIDMEVDHEKAVSLITSAARTGVPDAMNKLVEMYSIGIGVSKNDEAAIFWQEKLVEKRSEIYAETPNLTNLDELFWSCMDLGDLYSQQDDLENSTKSYFRGLQHLKESLETPVDDPFFTILLHQNLIICYSRIGSIYELEERLDRATECYEQALKMQQFHYEETKDLYPGTNRRNIRGLGICHQRLAHVYRLLKDFETAKSHLKQAILLLESLTAETDSIQFRRDTAVCYEQLGAICQEEGNYDAAEQYFTQVLTAYDQLVKESETDQSLRDLSVAYIKMAHINDLQGHREKIKMFYDTAVSITEQRMEKSDTLSVHHDLAILWDLLSKYYIENRDFDTATDYASKALEEMIHLHDISSTPDAKRNLSNAYEKLGYIQELNGALSSALQYYRKMLELRIQVAEESHRIDAQLDLSLGYDDIGKILRDYGHLDKAEDYFYQALQIRNSVMEISCTPYVQRLLSISYDMLGDLFQLKNEPDLEFECINQALQLRQDIFQAAGSLEATHDLSISYKKMGDFIVSTDLESAKVCYSNTLHLTTKIAQTSPSLESKRLLMISYGDMGQICVQEEQLSDATYYYQNALQLSKEIADESGTVEAMRDYSVSLIQMGSLLKRQNILDGAESCYRIALHYRSQILGMSDSLQHLDDFAAALVNLAQVCENQRKDLLTDAVQVYEKLCQKAPDVVHYRSNLAYVKRMLEE